jgi:sulfur relay (sulfurtransferase) DsrC/TusE family protein
VGNIDTFKRTYALCVGPTWREVCQPLQYECSQDQNIKWHHRRNYTIVNCELQSVWEDTVICYNIRQQRVRTFPRNISHDVWPLVGFLREPWNKTQQTSPTTSAYIKHYMQKTANNEQSGVAVMFWACFRKVVFSNVGRITGYHDGNFCGFRQPSQANVGI